jgi:hypothetical protein
MSSVARYADLGLRRLPLLERPTVLPFTVTPCMSAPVARNAIPAPRGAASLKVTSLSRMPMSLP